MEEIDKEKFEKAKDMKPVSQLDSDDKIKQPTKQEFEALLEAMKDPVKAQQEIAAKIKSFLDQRIDFELKKNGSLSSGTRMWVESYNNLLEKIQKAMHGDKSVNLHLVKVSHSDVAQKIRESVFEIENPLDEKEKEEKEKKKKKVLN